MKIFKNKSDIDCGNYFLIDKSLNTGGGGRGRGWNVPEVETFLNKFSVQYIHFCVCLCWSQI